VILLFVMMACIDLSWSRVLVILSMLLMPVAMIMCLMLLIDVGCKSIVSKWLCVCVRVAPGVHMV